MTLRASDLAVRFRSDHGDVDAVRGVSFFVEDGQTLALVGESGSGKSVTSLALLGLLDRHQADVSGTVTLDDDALPLDDERAMQHIRGKAIAMIFQDPMSSLNPFLTVERQLSEVLQAHEGVSRRAARARAVDMLSRVGIADAAKRARQYPHQFSGGMRQRAMIAMALLCKPRVLIADEPTTALDVTIQAQILELLRELQKELNTSIIFITHDLGTVAGLADRVAVMYGGHIVEEGPTRAIFKSPAHPYTRGLLASVPHLGRDQPLLPIRGQVPAANHLPQGCAFWPRCDEMTEACKKGVPSFRTITTDHQARCVNL